MGDMDLHVAGFMKTDACLRPVAGDTTISGGSWSTATHC